MNQVSKFVDQSTDEVSYAAKLLAIPAKRVSRQDAPAGKPRTLARKTPVRSKYFKSQLEGRVWVSAFWTAARTKAMQDILRRYALDQKTSSQGGTRRWLYVKKRVLSDLNGRRGTKYRARDYVTLSGVYEKKFFNREPKLRQWAINVRQYKRHVVYANDRRVLKDLVLAAALTDTKSFISKTFKKAVQTGLAGK